LLVLRDNSDLLNDNTLEVVNKLIGDKKLMSKVYVVDDWGSISSTIEFTVIFDKISVIGGYIESRFGEDYINIPYKKKIDNLYKSGIIPICMPLFKSRDEILEYIDEEARIRKEFEEIYGN
jgi:hypothetical protein